MNQRCCALLLALACVLPTFGQLPEPATPAAEAVPTATAVTAPPEALASPRATMRTFLEAFVLTTDELAGRDPLEVAATTLDLSALPAAVRGIKGPELAADLKDILDRTELIDFATIPDRRDGSSWVFLEREEGRVAIARGSDGAWRFDAETVTAIPALHQATASQELVEGVVENRKTLSQELRSRVPESLRGRGFLLETWQWLALIALALLGALVDRILSWIVQGLIGRWLEARQVSLDIATLRDGARPVGLFAMAVVWTLGLLALGLPAGVLQVLLLAAKFVAAVAMVWAAYKVVDVFAAVLDRRATRTVSRFDDLLVPLIRKSLKIVVVAVGLVFIADNLELDVTSLLAGLGVGGIAIALAAQDTVRNLFGSLTVLIERPFEVGDWVKINDVEGTVEELGFRSTRIRTFYDSLITLPNSNLISASIDNFGARQYRRWTTRLGIAYATPPDRIEAFCEGIRELIRRHPYTRKDYFQVYLNGFGASSLEILIYMFFETPGWGTELREKHRLGVDILRLASHLGVEFAFPTQTLFLRQDDGESLPESIDRGYSETIDGALGNGRDLAASLVDHALGGKIPPPEERAVAAEEDRGVG